MSIYKIKNTNLSIKIDEDLATLPTYNGELVVRIAADGLAHPMTNGLNSEQQEINQTKIKIVKEPLMGWGDHDCEWHYTVNGAPVAPQVIDGLSKVIGREVAN